MNIDQIPQVVAELRATFDTGRTRPLGWRQAQLDGLGRLLTEQEEAICQALGEDLGKPRLEAYASEIGTLIKDLRHARKHLAGWMRPERASTPLFAQPGRSRIYKDPLGVVLIISPWNYPINLLLAPLVGALSAGNAVLLKPSEVAASTSALMARLLPRYLDPHAVRVIEGGVPETTKILEQRFDHIFYTGNGTVGRIVMAAAAKHLTPVTLELGGKSPTYVDRTADLEVTARRLVWGKFFNTGQTCVAPDYVLAHAEVHDALLERMKATVQRFYGADAQASASYGRIINARHHDRLMRLIDDEAKVVTGGQGDRESRYIAPTILRDVDPDAPVMQDEIFGPILPVLRVSGVDEAIGFINARPKPLALYVFAEDDKVSEAVLTRTSSGGAVVNHVVLHLGSPELPFGGVGESGMGAYHGAASFDTFTHRKSVLKKPFAVDPPLLYPPYDGAKVKWLRRLV